MALISVGAALPLELLLADGATNKFPRAFVYDQAGVAVAGSPFALTHLANGLYRNTAYTVVSANQKLRAVYIIYNEIAYTSESSKHTRATDTWDVEVRVGTINTDQTTLLARLTAARAAALDLLDAAICTRASATVQGTIATDTAAVAARLTAGRAAALDFLDVSVASRASGTVQTTIAADAATLVGRLTAARATAIDNLDATVSSRASGTAVTALGTQITGVSTQVTGVQADTDDIQTRLGTAAGASLAADIASIKSDSTAIASRLTSARATALDYLDASVSSRASAAALASGITAITDDIGENAVAIETVRTDLSSARTAVLGDISGVQTKLDTVRGDISTIQNNTTARFVVPERLVIPEAGTKTYEFHLRLFDTAGNPEAPDSAPVIRMRRIDTGVDIVAGAAMTQDGAKVGAYLYQYTIAAGATEYPLLVEATVVEGGVTRYIQAVSEITASDTVLADIEATVSGLVTAVDAVSDQVNSGVYGLAAIKTGINPLATMSGVNTLYGLVEQQNSSINTALAALQTAINNLDIPASGASSAEVQAVRSSILTAINTLRLPPNPPTPEEIWGHSSRSLTDPQELPTDLLATKADLLKLAQREYSCRLGVDMIGNAYSLMVWGEKDGVRFTESENCRIEIRLASGALIWSQVIAAPNLHGVYTFTYSGTLNINASYYVTMAMTMDGAVRTSQTFFR